MIQSFLGLQTVSGLNGFHVGHQSGGQLLYISYNYFYSVILRYIRTSRQRSGKGAIRKIPTPKPRWEKLN